MVHFWLIVVVYLSHRTPLRFFTPPPPPPPPQRSLYLPILFHIPPFDILPHFPISYSLNFSYFHSFKFLPAFIHIKISLLSAWHIFDIDIATLCHVMSLSHFSDFLPATLFLISRSTFIFSGQFLFSFLDCLFASFFPMRLRFCFPCSPPVASS